ncbi:MAG: hypothetical protein V8T22_00450 [Oscillospiraceae bacterium]
MGYIPTKWKDHILSDNRYRINQNSDGTVSITPAGKVVQQGTPMSAENFNHMEEGIKGASELSDSAKKLETARKINGVSFDGTQDITIDVTGKTRRYELVRMTAFPDIRCLPEQAISIRLKTAEQPCL